MFFAVAKRYLVLFPVFVFVTVIIFTVIVPCSHPKDLMGYLHEIPVMLVGLCMFFKGFERLRKKNIIENIPTSKIRSVAMGLTEVAGTAQNKYPLYSPITRTGCVYYKFLVEKEKKGNKGNTYWTVINQGESTNYFYVEDNTGKILVDPDGAEIILPPDYKYTELSGESAPGARKRYTEWYIRPGDAVYVLGTVKKFNDGIDSHREKLIERLRLLKSDSEMMKHVDTDKDGNVSPAEWDTARLNVEKNLLEEELTENKFDDDILIGKSEISRDFVISDRSEKDIAWELGFKGYFMVISGFLVAILVFASFLSRTGILRGGPLIPWEILYKRC